MDNGFQIGILEQLASGSVLGSEDRVNDMKYDSLLLNSLAVYDKLLQDTDVGVLVLGSERNTVFSNKYFLEITGFEFNEIVKFTKFFSEFCEGVYSDKDEFKSCDRILSDLFNTGVDSYCATIAVNTKNGSRLVFELTARHMEKWFVLLFKNITQSYTDKRDLEWKKSYISSILNSLPDLILMTSINGTFTDAHAGSNELFLMPKDNLIGRHYREVMPVHLFELLDRAYKKINSGLSETHVNYQLDIKGTLHHFESRLVRLNEEEVVIIIRDFTDIQNALEKLNRQNEMQKLLTEISSSFITIESTDFDAAIDQSLANLGKFVEVDRFYVFSYDFEKMTASNTHEWCASGIEPQIDNLQNSSILGMDSWVDSHLAGKIMAHHNVHSLAIDDPVRQILEPQGIKSIITMPLMEGERCTGFIGLDYVKTYHDFREYEYQLLTIYSQMIVNLRKRLESEKAIGSQNLLLRDLAWNQAHLIRAPLTRLLGLAELLSESDDAVADSKNLGLLLGHVKKTSYEIDSVIRENVKSIEAIYNKNIN